jgi:hypothetical protein
MQQWQVDSVESQKEVIDLELSRHVLRQTCQTRQALQSPQTQRIAAPRKGKERGHQVTRSRQMRSRAKIKQCQTTETSNLSLLPPFINPILA